MLLLLALLIYVAWLLFLRYDLAYEEKVQPRNRVACVYDEKTQMWVALKPETINGNYILGDAVLETRNE